MTDDDTTGQPRLWMPTLARNAIARNLTKIEDLCVDLHWEALASVRDGEPHRDRMLGGEALNMIGPAAALEKWEEQYGQAEAQDEPFRTTYGGRNYADDQTDTHPLTTLRYWTAMIRQERDQPTDLAPTISRELDYMRKNLDWATRSTPDGDPAWPHVHGLVDDLAGIVHRIENVLSLGTRLDRTATVCLNMVGEGENTAECGGQLVRRTLRRRTCEHVDLAQKIADWCGATEQDSLRALLWYKPDMARQHRLCDQGGRDDLYRCLNCERVYTTSDYWLAVRETYEREAGA